MRSEKRMNSPWTCKVEIKRDWTAEFVENCSLATDFGSTWPFFQSQKINKSYSICTLIIGHLVDNARKIPHIISAATEGKLRATLSFGGRHLTAGGSKESRTLECTCTIVGRAARKKRRLTSRFTLDDRPYYWILLSTIVRLTRSAWKRFQQLSYNMMVIECL